MLQAEVGDAGGHAAEALLDDQLRVVAAKLEVGQAGQLAQPLGNKQREQRRACRVLRCCAVKAAGRERAATRQGCPALLHDLQQAPQRLWVTLQAATPVAAESLRPTKRLTLG